VPVHLILEMLAAGEEVRGVLEAYPFLSREDVEAALEYGAALTREEVAAVPREAA
jgi:uncharacterized protein (DUF433 family)